MDLLAFLTALTVMGAVVMALLALHSSTASPRGALERRLGTLLTDSGNFEVAMAEHEALRPTRTGRTPIISSLLEGKAWTGEMADRLERADIKLTVSEYVALRIFVAIVLLSIPMLFIGTAGLGLLAMIGAAFVGWLLPAFYVKFCVQRRINKLDSQLVEALTMISNSIKAGFGLMQSFDLSARQLQHPIATELRRTLYDINVGSTTEEALQNLAERSGSDDLDIVITAMLVQQTTGGNLSEILDNVAHTLRERIRIRGEIKTLTAQQMMTGFVIGGLPFVMAILFSMINPDYMTPLYTEPAGIVMLVGAGILEFVGVMLIKKILSIEV
jgi:tight adherence protein B